MELGLGQNARFSPRAQRLSIVALVGVLSLAILFHQQILNGFTHLISDPQDGFIEVAILEHWYNSFRLLEEWSRPIYFHPVPATLGYNDGYLIYGAIYSLFRAVGADMFLASELVNVVIRAIGYAGFYLACRRILALEWRWAAFGALMFTISNNAFMHAHHQQLLTVAFVPVLAVLLDGMAQAFLSKRRWPLLAWGASAAFFYAAWLLTAFYMAWFCVLFAMPFVLLRILVSKAAEWKRVWAGLRCHILTLFALMALFVLFCSPFLALYLPKAGESGMHRYDAVSFFEPVPLDIVHVGQENILFGWADRALNDHFRPGFPIFSEHTTGFPPGILALSVVALLWLPRAGASRRALLYAMGGAIVLSWLACLKFGDFSLYALIYDWVPGAKAVRVVSRYQIFLAGPVIALVTAFLASQGQRLPRVALAALGLFLIAEEINIWPNLNIDRKAHLARLAAIPSAPAECRAFYVSKADPDYLQQDPVIDGLYRHSVDAMLLAEWRHLPTINGYDSFVPPNYFLFYPERPDYVNLVVRHVDYYGVQGLCGLDMAAKRWTIGGPNAPVPPPVG